MGNTNSIEPNDFNDLSNIFQGIAEALTTGGSGVSPTIPIYKIVEDHFKSSAQEHVSNGIVYTPGYRISKMVQIKNQMLWQKYKQGCSLVQSQCNGNLNEKLLFHGTSNTKIITEEGFNSKIGRGMFGKGTYFATHSSKSNQYVFKRQRGGGCSEHKNDLCTRCTRRMLVCRVALGDVHVASSADCSLTEPPGRFTSVMGRRGHTQTGVENNVLKYDEYVVYEGHQVYPAFLIEYTMVLNNYRPQEEEDDEPEEVTYSDDEDEEDEEDENTYTNYSSVLINMLNALKGGEQTDFEDDEETLKFLVNRTRHSREDIIVDSGNSCIIS